LPDTLGPWPLFGDLGTISKAQAQALTSVPDRLGIDMLVKPMIDALELIAPSTLPLNEEFWSRFKEKRKPAHRSLPYSQTIDFRPQISGFVHWDHRHPIAANNRHAKIEFKEVKHLTAIDLVLSVQKLFKLNDSGVKDLKVSRVDFAADVYGVPIEWFSNHARVLYKRLTNRYKPVESTRKGVTTISFGKRPDLYRIYNKVEQLRETHRTVVYPGVFNGASAPVLTRVERQCSGPKVPTAVNTLGKLLLAAEDFDPFQYLVLTGAKGMPDTTAWNDQKWLMSLGLRHAVDLYGLSVVKSRLNRSGNASRLFRSYAELLDADARGITGEQLRVLYRQSTVKQLNQPKNGVYPKGGMLHSL
jgi:hypothetical protein